MVFTLVAPFYFVTLHLQKLQNCVFNISLSFACKLSNLWCIKLVQSDSNNSNNLSSNECKYVQKHKNFTVVRYLTKYACNT